MGKPKPRGKPKKVEPMSVENRLAEMEEEINRLKNTVHRLQEENESRQTVADDEDEDSDGWVVTCYKSEDDPQSAVYLRAKPLPDRLLKKDGLGRWWTRKLAETRVFENNNAAGIECDKWSDRDEWPLGYVPAIPEQLSDAQLFQTKSDEEEDDTDGEDEEIGTERAYFVVCTALHFPANNKAAKGWKPKKRTPFVFRGKLGEGGRDVSYHWQPYSVAGARLFNSNYSARQCLRELERECEDDEDWGRLQVPGEEVGRPFVAWVVYNGMTGEIIHYEAEGKEDE